jgi:hypothetical protein
MASLVGVAMFVVTVVTLHLLQPDYRLTQQLMSDPLASLLFFVSGVLPLGDTSEIHIGAIAGAFVLLVLAMYLYPSNAGRASVAAPRIMSWSLAAGVAASVALGHSVLPMGIGQRLAAACLVLWLAILGWRLRELSVEEKNSEGKNGV